MVIPGVVPSSVYGLTGVASSSVYVHHTEVAPCSVYGLPGVAPCSMYGLSGVVSSSVCGYYTEVAPCSV